jgi:hypothetical protein
MKIIITESQLSKIISENERMDKVIDRVLSDTGGHSYMSDILKELVGLYGFTPYEIVGNDRLYNFLIDKTINTSYVNWGTWRDYSDVLEALVSRYINEMFNTDLDPLKMIEKIVSIRGFVYDKNSGKHLKNLLDGLIDDAVNYIFDKYENPRQAIKYISILKDRLGRDSKTLLEPIAKQVAKEHGYTMINKPLGWTFETGGGRVQQIIDYIKDKPKLPQKTRKGWMEYVGQDPNRAGWNSYLWRAVQNAGIIQKVRDGRTFTYSLGPNAQAFEDGKLIGF